MSKLYATATNVSNIISVNVNESHASSTSIAVVDCINHSTDIGDAFTVNLGYEGDHEQVFTGYVKTIERKVPDNIYTITAYDVMVRALDYFIASSNPDTPFTRQNISAEDLIQDILSLAGLSSFDFDTSYFTLAITVPAEVNLVSAYDYSKSIADYVAWNLWADRNGTIHFRNRKPYPMDGTSGQPGDSADSPIATILTPSSLDLAHTISEKNLRNRVVVYGSSGIFAEASQATSYDQLNDETRQILPSGFYKAIVFATELITDTSIAQDSCDYNLALFNRLTHEVPITVPGDPTLRARETINITDSYLGITAEWYIYQLEHNWSKNGYVTSMSLRM